MPISIIRLGSVRLKGEGLRIGTVRRPPRGVPKAKFASENWYDVWLPELSPSEATVKLGQKAETDASGRCSRRRYAKEMAAPDGSRCSICSRRCRSEPIFRSAAIARTNRAATARSCAGLLKERGAKIS